MLRSAPEEERVSKHASRKCSVSPEVFRRFATVAQCGRGFSPNRLTQNVIVAAALTTIPPLASENVKEPRRRILRKFAVPLT